MYVPKPVSKIEQESIQKRWNTEQDAKQKIYDSIPERDKKLDTSKIPF